jgi:hypothetical protein
MYILLANLVRRFKLTIHDTTEADMEWVDLLLVQYVRCIFYVYVNN